MECIERLWSYPPCDTRVFLHSHFSCCAGMTEWTIRPDALGRRNFVIGIANENFDVQWNACPGGTSYYDAPCVSLYAWSGYILNNGAVKPYCSKSSTGDVVTLCVDMGARTMEYIVNGSYKGIAARDLPRGKYFCVVAFQAWGGEHSVTIV